MKTRLIIVRHAEAMGNISRAFHGWTDEGITEKGHKQAKLIAEKLKDMDIDAIYASSMIRTLQTAQYIADAKGLEIIKTDKLKEINGGDWERKKWVDLEKEYPDEYRMWDYEPHNHQMPGGEHMREFHERLVNEFYRIIKENEGKSICIVTHGTALRALMCTFRGIELDKMLEIMWHDNTAISIIDYEDGKFTVVIEGDNTHLGAEFSTILNQDWYQAYIKRFEET